jgi:hypothetical protein
MNEIIKKNAIKFGGIATALSVLYTYLVYAFNEDLFVEWQYTMIVQLVGLGLFVAAVVNSKKEMAGFISFREAFSSFMVAGILSIIIGTLFSLLLFHVIDTDLGPRIQDKIIVKMEERFEKMNMSDEQLQAMVDRMESQDTFAVSTQLKSILYGIIFYAFIGAIVAAILKKNRPEWEAIDETNNNE